MATIVVVRVPVAGLLALGWADRLHQYSLGWPTTGTRHPRGPADMPAPLWPSLIRLPVVVDETLDPPGYPRRRMRLLVQLSLAPPETAHDHRSSLRPVA